MAFNLNNFQFNRGVTTSNANGNGFTAVIHTYKSEDTLSTIDADNYFPPFIDGSTDKIFINDFLLIEASDGVSLVVITALSPFDYGPNLLSSSGLTVGPINPAISGDGAFISGNVLHLEFTDGNLPGILNTFSQNIGGVKTFNDVIIATDAGIKLTSSGNNLSYYNSINFSTTFVNGGTTTPSATFSVVRVGGVVTLMLHSQISFVGDAGGAPACISTLALPADFRPSNSVIEVVGWWRTFDGSNVNPPFYFFHTGIIKIDNGGTISIFFDNDETIPWPPNKTNLIDTCSFTYSAI